MSSTSKFGLNLRKFGKGSLNQFGGTRMITKQWVWGKSLKLVFDLKHIWWIEMDIRLGTYWVK